MAEFCAGIIFMDEEHKRFFTKNLPKCRDFDVYHMALIYCLGIDRTVREHFEKVYDLKTERSRQKSCRRDGRPREASVQSDWHSICIPTV